MFHVILTMLAPSLMTLEGGFAHFRSIFWIREFFPRIFRRFWRFSGIRQTFFGTFRPLRKYRKNQRFLRSGDFFDFLRGRKVPKNVWRIPENLQNRRKILGKNSRIQKIDRKCAKPPSNVINDGASIVKITWNIIKIVPQIAAIFQKLTRSSRKIPK
jgi:hypothetical protein